MGAPIVLFDGHGHEAAGRIVSISRSGVQAEIGQVVFRPRPVPVLTLAVAPPKGPRQDVLIEKCTELGVASIQPILGERTVAVVSDYKRDKWQRKAIEAAKQSGQAWLPELKESRPVEELLAEIPGYDLAILAVCPVRGGRQPEEDPASPTPIRDVLPGLAGMETILGLIGPEGGWTDAEYESLAGAGAKPVSLGPNTLRIETAAIALAAAVHALAH